MRRVLLGDLGSTQARLALWDGSAMTEIEKADSPAVEHFWGDLVELVGRYGEEHGVGEARLAVAAAFRGGIAASPKLAQSFPLQHALEERLGVPVRLANDLTCVATGELCEGALRGVSDAVVITVSTGLNAGVIRGGVVLPDPASLREEYGHREVPMRLRDQRFQPRICVCGRICYERYISGTAVYERAGQRGLEFEEKHDFDLLAARAHPIATQIYRDEGRLLAEWLAGILTDYPVPIAVLQGTFARRGYEYFGPTLSAHLAELVESPPELRLGELGDDAGLIGARYL